MMKRGPVLLLLSLTLAYSTLQRKTASLRISEESDASLQSVVSTVVEAPSQRREFHCSLIIIADYESYINDIVKNLSESLAPWGITTFQIPKPDDLNQTEVLLDNLISTGRKVRMLSWCVRILVMSEDVNYLTSFAEASRKHRLFTWPIKVMVVTRLNFSQLEQLMEDFWTFSSLNVMLLNYEEDFRRPVGIYTHVPYTAGGYSQVQRIASWTPENGLQFLGVFVLFPDKYRNFYGSEFKATGMPWEPNWKEWEEKTSNGTIIKKYSGSEYFTLQAIAKALNFSVRIIDIDTWAQGLKLVEHGEVDVLSVYHLIIPERLLIFDFTYGFEFAFTSFVMAKPDLRPRWQSLHYPFQWNVWMALLLLVLLMPILMAMVTNTQENDHIVLREDRWQVIIEVLKTLLGQDISTWMPTHLSARLMLITWLIFAFIVGTAYRGNLTASLTLPRYPPRAETIEDFVNTVDRATMIGKLIKRVFKKLSSPVSQKLSDLIIPGVSVKKGLQLAAENNQGHMASRRHMQHMLAKYHTEADGSSKMYVGRENVVPGLAGWPIPLDSPYKEKLDWCLMAILEAGLFEKWNTNMLTQTVTESRKEKQEIMKQQPVFVEEETDTSLKALTIVHMQGPLMFFFLGLVSASIIFAVEITKMFFSV